jgi:hypothetical protein
MICTQPSEPDVDVIHMLHRRWCDGEASTIFEDEAVAFEVESQRLFADLSTGLRNNWFATIKVRRRRCFVGLCSICERSIGDDE